MDKVKLAKLLGLQLFQSDDHNVVMRMAEETEQYGYEDHSVEFTLSDDQWGDDKKELFEVTSVDLEGAWEAAADIVIEGLKKSIEIGIKLG